MAARRPFSTIPDRRMPVVVVVAPSDVLLDAVHEAIRFVAAVQIVPTDIPGAATSSAVLRPFAIVIDEDLLAFDPKEFEALARDVGAELVATPGVATPNELLGFLLARLKPAYRKWDERGDGTP